MKISLNKNVIIKDYETKGLLIDVERADYRKVNSSGLTISKFLNKYGEISVEELLLKLSDLYELPEEVFGEEVQQFLDDMIEKGFFVKDGDYSRIETEETICHQTSNGIWIKVTNRCNLRCSYCYADSGEGEANELTIEEIENLLIELKPKNYNKIVITGGDPLMRKDIVEILKTCKKYGKVQILTNGTIGNAELYREIMEIVDAIQISLDSYEEIHHDKNRGKGSFVRAVNTVKTLTHINNKKVIVAMTPNLGIVFDSNYFVDEWNMKMVEKAMSRFYKTWNHLRFYSYIEQFKIAKSKKVKELSKGMQMKLMLACAFSYDSKLLILDEPTSGLDPVSRDELLEIIEKYVEDGKHSVLFSTHITSDLEKVADYITYINYGELIYSGEKKKLLEEFYVIRNVREEIPIGIREKLIGVRKTKDGVQALLKKEYIKEISGLGRIEKATLDDIVVFTSKGE